MLRPTFNADWRHVAAPLVLTVLIVGAALGFAFS